MPALLEGTLATGLAVREDHWVRVDATSMLAEIDPSTPVLIPFAIWQVDHDAVLARFAQCGVVLAPADDPMALLALDSIGLIAIEFPVFTDGRGYSSAHIVRERLAYRGHLRALGDVLRDQVFYLLRCGFDSLALRADQDANACLGAVKDFRDTYQRAVDQPVPLYRRRGAALARLDGTG